MLPKKPSKEGFFIAARNFYFICCMKAATIKELKEELTYKTQAELLEYCLKLSKFKKENKRAGSQLMGKKIY